MAKNEMVNMAAVVAEGEVAVASLSEKERAMLAAVAANPMATIVSARAAAKQSVMVAAGVVVALIRKGYVVSYKDRFGCALALSPEGEMVAASL